MREANFTTFMYRMSWKSGSLNLLEHSGPHLARYGTPLPFITYSEGTFVSLGIQHAMLLWDQLVATNSDLLVINSISTCFGHLYVHHQEIRLRSTVYSCKSCCSCCDAGESGGKMCALCGECCLSGNILHTVHTSFYPNLQHQNSYNRTDNYRQWNAVGSPDDGLKDARNMLRYYWLPINHYLLLLVGLTFTYIFIPLMKTI